MASWKRLKLDPAGLPATSNGAMTLQWKASNFSDASGSGAVALSSQYGNVQSDVQIQNAKAVLKLSASAPDATATATLKTGLDQKIDGSFQASYRKYGDVSARGDIKGTLTSPLVHAALLARGITYSEIGPLNGSADALLQNNVVLLKNIRADLKHSTLDNATARVDLNSRRIEGQIPEVLLHIEDVASEASGVATLSAEVNGLIDKPAASFRGSSSGLMIGETHIDSAQVEGHLEDDIVVLDRIEATQTDGRLAATGTMNIRTREVGAHFNVDNLAIKNIHGLSATAFLNGGIGGGLNIHRRISWGNSATSSMKVSRTATLRCPVPRLEQPQRSRRKARSIRHGYPPQLSFVRRSHSQQRLLRTKARFDISNTKRCVGNSRGCRAGPAVQGGSSFAQNLTANGNGVDLKANGNLEDGIRADIVADLSRLPVDGVTLTGTADAHAVLTGTVEHPVVDGTIETGNATVRTPQMSEAVALTTSVSFNQNQYEIRKMRAEIAGGYVDIQGTRSASGGGESGVSCCGYSSRSFPSRSAACPELSLPMEPHRLPGLHSRAPAERPR
jgi:autotransporter translocation and assembly factor TamB